MKSVHLLTISTAIWLGACSQKQAAPPAHTIEVGVVTLKSQPVALQAELSGRTTASLTSEVRPQVTGIIRARKFTEGGQVQAGQVLYEIDPSSYQATYDEAKGSLADAEAQLTSARLKAERYAELVKIEGVSKQDADDTQSSYEQAQATVTQRKAALESAHINLMYTQVKAPISGRIGISSVTPGALVTANQSDALATIRMLDPIYVDLAQSSADLLKLRATLKSNGIQQGSATVKLKLEDGTDYSRAGVLKFREVAVDEATGSVTLRAEFPNPDGTLLPGMYVRAVLDQAMNPNGILAPQQGITRDPKGNASAMVVNNQDQVEQRAVKVDRAMGDQWLVPDGLQVGDRLIVEGLNKIRIGDKVSSVDVSQGSKLASSSAAAPSSKKTGD